MSNLFGKITEVSNVVVNSVSASASYAFNASNVEVLKVRRDMLKNEFEKKKKQNEIYNRLKEDKQHLEQLILMINAEKTHYDIRHSTATFLSEDGLKMKGEYRNIIKSLDTLNISLQDSYSRLNSVTEMTNEKFEEEKITYEAALKEINDEINKSRQQKKSAGESLVALRKPKQTSDALTDSTLEDLQHENNIIDDSDEPTTDQNHTNQLNQTLDFYTAYLSLGSTSPTNKQTQEDINDISRL